VRPVVTGSATVGGTLAATSGSWTLTPTALRYAWQRCDAIGRTCAPVAGATAATYIPTGADVGSTLVPLVTAVAGSKTQATLGLASRVVSAAGTGAGGAPAPSSIPAIVGAARAKTKLTSVPPTAASGATFAYQWYRCDAEGSHCASIHGATGSSYTTVAADATKTIGLTVQATVAGTTTPSYSSLLGPIAAATATIVSNTQAAPSGVAMQGQALTLTGGTWSAAASSFTYAWLRCNANGRICATIAGATAASYTPTADDVGHRLVASVTAKNATTTASALSIETAPIAALPVLANTVAPTVAGAEKVGQKLTAASGTWTGTAPIAFTYQWYRCDGAAAHCSSIHGATAATYKLVTADGGKTVALTVTAKDSTGTKAAYAAAVGLVAAAASTLFATAQPTVTGKATAGSALTVSAGAWSVTPTTTFTWERCNANGRICAPIAGATSSSYTVVSADAAHALVALVHATAGGTTQTAFSTIG
jgi:hypothetical protein